MSECQPIVWPENPPPDWVRECTACGLLEQGTRVVWGEGNPDAALFVILDNPGAREDRSGQPFVCGTRQTLQLTATQAGFDIEHDLYITYILKHRPIRAYDKERARKACMTHLLQQLQELTPSFIICLGNVAVQSFFGDPEASVKSLRGKWYEVRGIPTTVSYHPLAVRRRPNLARYFLEDWQLAANRIVDLSR